MNKPPMVKLSLSSNFHNKENRAELRPNKHTGEKTNLWAFTAFSNATMPLSAIVKHVTSGKAICVAALTTNWRKTEKFASSQLMGIDFDQSPGVDALLEDTFVSDYSFLVYPTPTHTDAVPRSRVLFALDEPITDVEQYRRLIKRLMHRFSIPADEACKDPVRLFFGSDKQGYKGYDMAVLPISVLEALPIHPDELPKPMPPMREVDTSNPRALTQLEAYGRAAKENILNELWTLPDGMDMRHGKLNAATMVLAGFSKGGWSAVDGWENEIRQLGRQWGRAEQEIEASIRGAYEKATPHPRALPDNGQRSAQPEAPRANVQERHGAPEVAAPPVVWRTSAEAQVSYRESLRTARTDGTMPLIFPFKALHPFGGFARVLDAGILVGVVGMSGGLKTSFLETVTDAWRRMDANHFLWWGTEWDSVGMAARAIQRYGGASIDDKLLHDMWLMEEKQGIPVDQRFGKALPEHVIRKTEEVSKTIESWQGKNHHIDDPVTDVNVLLDLFDKRIEELKAQGTPIRGVVWDYMQLLDLYSAKSDSEKTTAILGKLKVFCIDHKVLGLVASQVTKASANAAKTGDDVLQAESGQNFRSDKFNLVLTLNPIYEGKLLTDRGAINVAKNSTGKTGVQTVFINPARFTWVDKVVPESQQVKREDLDEVEF